MKNKLNGIKKIATAALIGVTSLVSGCMQPNSAPTRVRVESDISRVDANNFSSKSIVQVTPKEVPGLDFKSYTFAGQKKGNDVLYSTLGVSLPTIKDKESDFEQKTFLYGSVGSGKQTDQEGFGIESSSRFGGTTLVTTIENSRTPGKVGDRFGFGIDQKIDNVTVGAGFDTLTVNGNRTNYFLGRAVVDATPTDQAGFAFQVADVTSTGSTNISGLAYAMHFGKEEKWGARAIIKADGNSKADTGSAWGDVILCQNPTFIPISGWGWTSRESTNGAAGFYNMNLVENPFSTERCPVGLRTKDGFADEFSFSYTDNRGNISWNAKNELAFTIPITDSVKIAPTAFYNYSSTASGDKQTAGASILAQMGPVILEGNFSETITKGSDFTVYVRAGAGWDF